MASETLQPVLTSLGRAMEVVSGSVHPNEGKALMNAVNDMVQAVFKWVQGQPELANEELRSCQVRL